MTSSPNETLDFVEYASRDALADQLTEASVERLKAAIAERGQASIAVSGGSTPKMLYQRLSKTDLDWSKVHVVLMDERWVEPGTEGSGETFVKENLLQNQAALARFTGLKAAGETPLDGLDEAIARLDAFPLPFDIVFLGMGVDGHTGSWYPRALGLSEALSKTGALVAAIEAKRTEVSGPYTQRITLSRAALEGAGALWLLITGADKREALDAALGAGPVEDMPIRALLRAPDAPLKIHWAA